MKETIGAVLIAVGVALLGWVGYVTLHPVAHYTFVMTPAPADAAKEVEGFDIATAALQRVEISSPEERRPVATGLVARDDGRLAPLVWRNEVTEPIFFADVTAADATKVLAAIREHVPEDAVVLAWWDFSRAIRIAAKRQAPLDDPQARGLLIPAAWLEAREAERARWGAGVNSQSEETFSQFIDALTATDEAQGASVLKKLAGGKPAYVAVHISDVWKAAAVKPDRLSVAFKDFASSGVSHGVIKSAQQWMREQKIEGGFAVEPTGGAMRLHYFQRKGDSDALIARLLPFSTSNPMQMERLELVYQHKGWWIYRLKD